MNSFHHSLIKIIVGFMLRSRLLARTVAKCKLKDTFTAVIDKFRQITSDYA